MLLIGLDNAGKTTTVMRLLGREFVCTSSSLVTRCHADRTHTGSVEDIVPTIGFSNVEMKQINDFAVEMYDLGGGAKIRDIWKNYFSLVHGVIYVIDSTDDSRIPEAKANLEAVMQHENITKKPVLM